MAIIDASERHESLPKLLTTLREDIFDGLRVP